MLFLNFGILENLGYLCKFLGSHCVFLVTLSTGYYMSHATKAIAPFSWAILTWVFNFFQSLYLASPREQDKVQNLR
jgi:hypothetical protein